MQIYALCDQSLLDKKHLSIQMYLNKIAKYNIKILQYRAKNSSKYEIKQQLTTLRNAYNGCLIINDYVDLVYLCDGVHVGQDDLKSIDRDIARAVVKLRNMIGEDKIIGISTHNKDEVLQSNELDIEYIGLGAYRQTSTKSVSNILGQQLDDIASLSTHKVAAIGGVTMNDTFEFVTYKAIGGGLL